MSTGVREHDLRTFSLEELQAMLPKAQRWDGNPYPREWIEREIREREARNSAGRTARNLAVVGTVIYTIRSHWDGRMSSLHKSTYETLAEAVAACRAVGGETVAWVLVDPGNEWFVYADEDDADADANGAARNAIAEIIESTAT